MQDIKSYKTARVDKLLGRFLQCCADILFSALCNLSVYQGVFPNTSKFAKLKPLFKKGKKTDPSSYRPISLLPAYSKIIEKVVHDQTKVFLSAENIYNYLSGLRANH